MMLKSIELRASRNAVIHHQQVQPFLTVLVMDGGNQHAAGINAHHRAGRQVRAILEATEGVNFGGVGSLNTYQITKFDDEA